MKADQLFDEHVPAVADLAKALRVIVRDAMPDAEERVYTGWHGLGYRHPGAGYVCGIFPVADAVKLGFEQGHLLPDPESILEQSGTQVRYVVLRPGDEIPKSAITAMIDDAVELAGAR